MAKTTTSNFDLINARPDKEPLIVLQIDGVDYLFGSNVIYSSIRYGDPGLNYGDPGIIYGGLRPVEDPPQLSIIDRKGSNASINQKLEQWDGRASVEVLSLKLIDYHEIMTQVCTPGLIIPEILNQKVTVWFGYQEISFPEDYIQIFRGYVNQVTPGQGFVTFQFTDPSSKRKQIIFNGATATLTKPLYSSKKVTIDIPDSLIELDANGLQVNDTIAFMVSNGDLPPPLVVGTEYFVVNPTTDNFQISLTSGGSPITILPYPIPPTETPVITIRNFNDGAISLSSTDDLYRTILDGFGNADPAVTIGISVDDKEIITYTNANITSSTLLSNTHRAQFGTVQQDFDIGTQVKCFINLADNPLSIALKVMLSGFNGPFVTGVNMRSIVNDDAGHNVPDSFTLGHGVSATRDYGLSVGDYCTISGSAISANNGIFTVADFTNENRTVIVQQKGILIQEGPTNPFITATVAFRSKYDVYPVDAGLNIVPQDVFVTQWETIRDTFVPFNYDFSINGQEDSAKDWIEMHLLRPIGAYSLTQNAQISVGKTHPPLVTDLSVTLDPSNVINTSSITVDRGLTNRFFYNSVRFDYNWDPLAAEFDRTLVVTDADAISRMRQVSEIQFDARGFSDTIDNADILEGLANRILQRYRFGAETITLQTFFGTGNTIDAGDTVVLTDTTPPTLQIMNSQTGSRGIYDRIMEVQERRVGVTEGNTQLTLLSNNGFSFTDRYAVIAPASTLDPAFAATTTLIRIQDSFFNTVAGTEPKKWIPYNGSWIKIFNPGFTIVGVTKYTLDDFDPFQMHLDPALGFTPTSDMVITFEDYDDTSAVINALVKASFVHWDPSSLIASGSSQTVFTLDAGLGLLYQSGMIVYVMSPDGARFSPDVKILTVVGDIITIGPIYSTGANPDLGFTPQAGDILQLGGFKDGGRGYRLI